MEKRIYNFSAGPAILPEEALKEAQDNLMALPGVGMSILEISHRSKTFAEIHAEAKNFWTYPMIMQYYSFREVQVFNFLWFL
jgi:phosphoserine aminotransferase